MMCVYCVCALAAAAAVTVAADGVTVVQLRLSYDYVHQLPLNNSVEYIIDFSLDGQPSEPNVPSLLWVHTDVREHSRPVLITVRQPAGAQTWQLPYQVDGGTAYELERTLCPDNTATNQNDPYLCDGEGSSFSLQVSTACAHVTVSVRASRPSDWRLTPRTPLVVTATPWAPRVVHYRFEEGQRDVRLVLSSESDVCATVLVHNYTCPIVQELGGNSPRTLRMTMMRSAGIQLSRDDYPMGFMVVAVVMRTEEQCGGPERDESADWLWEAAMLGRTLETHEVSQRRKVFTITVQEALSRKQYVMAAAATLSLFVAFYLLVGGVVLAQRWPPFGRYVLPRAVLADCSIDVAGTLEANGQAEISTMPGRRRRGSDATYDSSDNSDSDYDEDAGRDNTSPAQEPPGGAPDRTDGADDQRTGAATPSQIQGPFGLPARLRLAALARRGGRTLRARSDRYLFTLATVAVFYALPVVQFVIAFQIAMTASIKRSTENLGWRCSLILWTYTLYNYNRTSREVMNLSGSLDICYYNFLCAHRLGGLSDFNHVLSNLGYLLLGGLFLLQVRRRSKRRVRQPRNEEYGIPAHYGMLSALGLGMMVVALLSASYHICPNRLNFQFDTAFMYVLAVIMMVKIYQTRHPDVNARAHATFGVLALLIAIVVWGVLGGGPVFWGVFTVLHIFTFLLLSLRIYYLGQLRLEAESLALAALELRKDLRPLYGTRLVMLVIGNALNWCFAFYGLVTHRSDFATHLLQVLLGNALVYMIFYLVMKIVHGERLRWYAWALLAAAAAAWVPALYFFISGSSDWSTTPALSRHLNHECKVLQFYDSHDLWHMLSAVALYLTFSAILTWDDGLSAVKRTDIPVF